MARPKNTKPVYKLHVATENARCWWNGSWTYLGKYGSDESHKAYRALLARIKYSPPDEDGPALENPFLTIGQLVEKWDEHAKKYYRNPDDGTPTSEFRNFKASIRPMFDLYCMTPAAEFGPKKLKAVRQKMIDADLCRSVVNRQTARLKQVFKWAVAEELVPAGVFHALVTVTGLRSGRGEARERKPIAPVADDVVDATLPHLNRYVRGLVQFQRFTGCRPGEAVLLRLCDIDTSGPAWLFTPSRHKNSHRGKSRTIPIGPKGQQLLAEHSTATKEEYVFSPIRVEAELRAARSRERKTPRYPSHMARNKNKRVKKRERKPGKRYTSASYAKSINRAVKLANAGRKGKDLDLLPEWHPNQLRHTFGTKARKAFGLEAAGAALGHAKMSATEIYAERDGGLAVEVALKIG